MRVKARLRCLSGTLRRWGALALAALAVLSAQPASARFDDGFVPEGRTSSPVAPSLGLFHTRAIPVPTNRFRHDWDDLIERYSASNGSLGACADEARGCPTATGRWVSYLAEIRTLPRKKQIVLINRYINWHIRYTDDRVAYGSKDYWASPLQSMGGRGDCEDYATAKYFSLLSLGFSDDQIRLVIVRDDSIGQLHALTTVSLDGETYVLDNRFQRVLHDSQIPTYRPIYSFNQSTNWMHLPDPAPRTM
jgi:predicted transglutaminase-like cysteine proteinase